MFCRAWDTMLTLDGEVKGRTVADNRRLSEFVQALPAFGEDTPNVVVERCEQFARELLTTVFVLPDGLSSVQFWPLGSAWPKHRPFKDVGNRLLVVSPFVSLTALEALAADTTECSVVSTIHQLGALSRRPKGVSKFYVLNEKAVSESDETAAALSEPMADAIAQGDLHAKLYVTEFGAEAHVWTGSVNATEAALNRNVEFMVEMIGPRRQFGIDTLMKTEKDQVRLIDLIRDVTDGDAVAGQSPDEDMEALEKQLDSCRAALIEARLEAQVTKREDAAFKLVLQSREQKGIVIDDGLSARCWPVSTDALATAFQICQPGEPLVQFPQMSLEAITSFFAFELTGRVATGERQLRFVLNLPLIGAPADRKDQVLRSFLGDRGRFLRFMMLLLADEGFDPAAMGELLEEGGGSADGRANADASGLLEVLLHALDVAPTRLDHLESLLRQITVDDAGKALLPNGFDELWQPIWAHRLALRDQLEAR